MPHAGQRSPLLVLFERGRNRNRVIREVCRQYGYRLTDIAANLGVHSATVSRRLRQAEQTNECMTDSQPTSLFFSGPPQP